MNTSKVCLKVALMLILVAPAWGQQKLKLTAADHESMFSLLITKLKASQFYTDAYQQYQDNKNLRISIRPQKTLDKSGELDPSGDYLDNFFITPLQEQESEDSPFKRMEQRREAIINDNDKEVEFQAGRGEITNSSVKATHLLKSVFSLLNDSDASTLVKTYTWRLELVALATNSTVWSAKTTKEITASLR